MKIATFLNIDKETFETEINSFLSQPNITVSNTYVAWNGMYFGVIEYTEVKA